MVGFALFLIALLCVFALFMNADPEKKSAIESKPAEKKPEALKPIKSVAPTKIKQAEKSTKNSSTKKEALPKRNAKPRDRVIEPVSTCTQAEISMNQCTKGK